MPRFKDFTLPLWIEGNIPTSEVVLAGSLGPGLSLNELTELSKDPAATAKAFNFHDMKLAGGTGDLGGEGLRKNIASLYDQNKVKVHADDVIIANGTTGANMLLFQSLISPGDHIVAMYPTYGPLLEIPKILGADMSYWRLNEENAWKTNLDDLKSLLKPSTKMLVINNPHNPTGLVLSTSEQADILKIAAEHNIIVHCDEIFRPLFHSGEVPTSILEHDFYDRTIATGSVSKAWCFSGIRVGWCVTRNRELRDAMIGLRQWTIQSTSTIDELVAQEILSERCQSKVHARISGFARENLNELQLFVKKHSQSVTCNVPNGGSIAFVKFINPQTGQPVDDLEFCKRLKQDNGVLLSPGSFCFGTLRDGDFRGYVRLHFTVPPEMFKNGLERISTFLTSQSFTELSIGHEVNGERANGVNGL